MLLIRLGLEGATQCSSKDKYYRSANYANLLDIRSLGSSLPSDFAPSGWPNTERSAPVGSSPTPVRASLAGQRAQLDEALKGHQKEQTELPFDREQCKRQRSQELELLEEKLLSWLVWDETRFECEECIHEGANPSSGTSNGSC